MAVLYTLCAIHSSVNLCSSCNMSLLSDSDSVKLIACDLIFYNSSIIVLSFVFHFSFMRCNPLGSNYLVRRVLCIGVYISLILGCGSLPLELSLLFWSRVSFLSVALDDIQYIYIYILLVKYLPSSPRSL